MKSKVLVVDDQPSHIKVVKMSLKMSGFEVIEAANGYEGVEKTKEERPFLILMDLRMPVMDGITAMKKIREIDEFKNLPILAFTAHSMKEDRDKLIREGFNEHMSKPVSIKDLITVVNRHYSHFTNLVSRSGKPVN